MTICSYDNSGQLKFAVDIEMAQGYWNTSSSRLWSRIRDLMHDELVEKYNNMRQNGLSYESLMECFYDEQIAKIPQKYYNMDYDVKYAPFADSYIGMANGDTYEHLKRWLQQRLRFVDTLYDYAPSYNNDVLTIRANTTEPMTLEIETYTPVYQHLSWYNNQMDKKKIDGKTSVTFTGTAMAATDQEVLIYGGSNIKSIKGITSMNPNRMLIGSATRLIELDAPNCPLLADINANKANLAPHVYLNKVNLSGCPLLGGNLIVNQSPLIREIDISNTSITGLNLSSNLRNLEVLKLPSAITNMVLNDASQLHTLEFDEGCVMQSVSMTNCNALTNVTNFNLENVSNITLNNSYNIVNELYFSKTANLSVSNMPNLERIIYTPNAEHEVFDKANVNNASNYTISTFNCPRLNEFITTAPYRNSYDKEYGEKKPNEVFEANVLDISSTQFTDVKLLCTTDTNKLLLPKTVKNLIVDSAYDLDTAYLTDGDYDTIHTELYEPYNTDYDGEVYKHTYEESTYLYDDTRLTHDTSTTYKSWTDYISVNPNSFFKVYALKTLYSVGIAEYDKDKVMIKSNWKPNENAEEKSWSVTLTSTTYYVVCELHYNRPGQTQSGGYKVVYESLLLPNLVPSASDGSLIFSMYAPNNTTEPASEVWDMKGLEFDTFHTFGLNNDVKLVDDTLTMPNRLDGYSNRIDNLRLPNEIAVYTASDNNTFPEFNAEFKYSYVISEEDGIYIYRIIADDMDNLPTNISFNGKSGLLTVEYLNTSNVTSMNNMFRDCSNLTSLDLSSFDTSKVTYMSFMFGSCRNLTNLEGIENWDTSKVTDMNGIFNSCNKLTNLKGIENWDTSNVTVMNNMFNSCINLTSLDLSNFDTSKVTYMTSMFNNCNNLTNLDLSNLDTSKVTYMNLMFNGCTNLTSLDLSNFDTSEVTNMSNMFNGCTNLTSLDLSNFDTSKVTNISSMFAGCNSLTSLDVSNFDTSKVTTMGNMFQGCTNLTSLDVSNFDTSKVTNISHMFQNCNNLTSLDVSNFDTSKVTNMGDMFSGCTSLQELHIESWVLNDITQTGVSTLSIGDDVKNEIYTSAYFTIPNGWKLINILEIARYTTNTSGVLPTFNNEYSGYSTQELENEGIYTVGIATDDMNNLPTSISFSEKSNLLTIEYLNTSNITSMVSMFSKCSNLVSVNLSNQDCSKVTDTYQMFVDCSSIRVIDLTNTNMPLTSFRQMFCGCGSLEEIKCDGWINESMRNYAISSYGSGEAIVGCNKLKTDVYMYLCTIYRMSVYCNTNATEPRIIDFSGIDTSNLTSLSIYGNTTSIINLHCENGVDLSLRGANSLTHIDSYHFKWAQYGFFYYECLSDTLDIIFETTENSTNYKYENWTPGLQNKVIGLSNAKFTVASIISFLECLYDYVAKGETTNAVLHLGNNLNRLTPEQIAVATNKGWTLT